MKIFASWSGEESKQIAELLKAWIPCVIQESEVYVSSQDIGKGERWLASVSNNLAEIDFGIIVVTKSNVNAPWILFEAGALSKSVRAVVAPLLCGVENFEAAKSPLTQFQYVRPVENEMRDLMIQINSYSSKPLEQARIERSFSKWWPEFQSGFETIKLPDAKPVKKESDNVRLQNIEDALSEVMLELRRIRTVETKTSIPSSEAHFEYASKLARKRMQTREDGTRRIVFVKHPKDIKNDGGAA